MNDSLSAEGRQDSLWEWYPCVFDLKKVLKNKEVFYNLAPSIVLKHPNSTEEKVKLKLKNLQNNIFFPFEAVGPYRQLQGVPWEALYFQRGNGVELA